MPPSSLHRINSTGMRVPADHGLAPIISGLTSTRAWANGVGLIVDPLLLEAGVAVALAGHLDPTGQEARRGEQ